jgi:uncharacterized membrane protein YhiD involved in acid resistance
MIKNITIGVLLILTVLSSLFAFIQQTEANRQREIAVLNLQCAAESEKRAQEQMQVALMSQREAELQYKRAMDCCNMK